ncbi:hypothetical protein R1flu_026222 [Riccia fluitans]|uniref:Reverse transcriptase Ty1/copia-type domain-containing protein n=1 Tax=Riccia fluitans TaxID=41844 RepID=A0ABD1XFX8_9MARC
MSTWTLVPLPPGRRTVGCKWVFKVKTKPDGSVSRYKARLVAQGYSQIHGVDYTDTFSPVVRLQSIRVLFAVAVQYKMHIHQMDVKTAFLNGFLEEEVYMRLPEGLTPKDSTLVCKLHRALYGLKQSSRAWFHKIDTHLKKVGFSPLAADSNIYLLMDSLGLLVLALYVDDILLLSASTTLLSQAKQLLHQEFDMTDLGKVNHFLGIHVDYNFETSTLKLSQKAYILLKLARFNLSTVASKETPMVGGAQFTAADCPTTREEKAAMELIPYSESVGSLMWIALCTRQDIAFAVFSLAQFMSNLGQKHWIGVKRVFRYLASTQDLVLRYQHSTQPSQLLGYSDADWGGDTHTRKSTSGYCFLLSVVAISWSSTKQKSVALSTTKSEYMALSKAAAEAIWLRSLVKELEPELCTGAIILFCDNTSAISLSKTGKFHDRSKHIDIRHKFVNQQVADGHIKLLQCRSTDQIADILTKPLAKVIHTGLVTLLGLVPKGEC